MEELLKLLDDYTKRHNMKDGVTLHIGNEGSGQLRYYEDRTKRSFEFKTADEFLKKISK